MMKNKEHLTREGILKIIAIRVSMNLGLSNVLKTSFPDIIPISRLVVTDNKIKNPNWLAGFTSGEGCFMINLNISPNKPNPQVQLVFQLTQHSRDEKLMRGLIEYLGCGNVRQKRESFVFIVTKFEDLLYKIIPRGLPASSRFSGGRSFFNKYPIQGQKNLII